MDNTIGPKGTYSDGKLFEGDKGDIGIAIYADEDDYINIEFGTQVAWLALSADDAKKLVKMLVMQITLIENKPNAKSNTRQS